jgi:endogenous inhibitor of DNA gyrase (YacG/DUF329 family)
MNAPGRHACPTCDRAIAWSEEFPFRPFCSDRCRLVDLGAWLNGQHAIPGEPVEPGELPEFGSDADERS